MAQFLLQSDFKYGEISPLLYAHAGSPIFQNGAKRLRNCLVIPQGGATRRFGTLFELNLTSIESNYLNYKPFSFVHQDGSKYILLFTPLAITVIHNDAVVATVVSTYTTAEVRAMDIAQSNDLVFITVVGKSPAILSRTSAHAGWSLNATPTFTHEPSYDYAQNYDAMTFTVVLSGSTSTILSDPTNTVGTSVIVNASSALFTTDYVGGLFFGGGATIRFTGFVDNQNLLGIILKVMDEKTNVLDTTLSAANRRLTGQQCVITEKMFSANRGWPEKVSFFQNRIWFAKTASLPGLIVGSNFNGFTSGRLNFDDSRTLETSAVSTVIYGRRATTINHIMSYKSLLVFTTSGVYSTSLDLFEPVTPLNINFINLQAGDISNDLLPNILENSVIFYDRGGNRVKTLVLTEDGNNYQAATLNILAPHLIDNPYSSAVLDSSETIDGSYLLVVNNEGDMRGKLAVYNLIQEQGVTAWTLQETGVNEATEGFRHVISDGQDVYFIVERTVDGGQRLYLERLSFDVYTDCTVEFTQSSSETIAGLSALQGLDVDVVAGTSSNDRGFEGVHTVAGNQVTIDTAVTQGYVGIRVTPLIGTLPLIVPTQMGNNVFRAKMIKSLYVDFYESLGIRVNDTSLRFFQMNDTQTMDAALVPQTNFEEVTPMSGWDPRTEIVITQNEPNPFTIIGMGMNIEV